MARVGLVDRRRRDRPVRVVRQPLLDLRLRRAVGRERDEEVALPASPRTPAARCTTRRRGRAAGTPATGRRRRSRRRRQRDEARSRRGTRAPSRSTPRRPRASPPRSAGGRCVVLAQDLDVVGVAGRRPGRASVISASRRSNSRLAAVAQRARVVGEDLALLEDPRVALLAQLPRAVGSSEEGLEVRDPALEMRRGRRRAAARSRSRAAASSTSRQHEVADVARGAPRARSGRARRSAGGRGPGRGSRSPRRRRAPTWPRRAIAASTRSASGRSRWRNSVNSAAR